MELTNDYCQNFNSEWFLTTYHGSVADDTLTGRNIRFALSSLHKYFTSNLDFGDCLLDVGTGPTIWSVLSASRRVKTIALSDFMPQNLKILNDWKDGKRSDVISHIELEMEFAGNSLPVHEREAEVRSKVTGIHQVDITRENIFVDANLDGLKFDVITSSFCFECASNEKENYVKSVRHVSKLLKQGGYLVLLGCIGASYYRVDKFLFPVCPLTVEEIRSILERNGFEILNMETLYKQGSDQDFVEDNTLENNRNVFTLLARKVSPKGLRITFT